MTDVDLLRTLHLASTLLVVFRWLALAAHSLTTLRASLWRHFYVKDREIVVGRQVEKSEA